MVRASLLLALAAPVTTALAGPAEAKEPEEVVVYGQKDGFARWDGTRWYVHSQIGFPQPYKLYAVNNHEMEPVALDVETVFACEKTWRRSKKRHEVDCTIEDVALQAASWRRREPHAEEILNALDAQLTGASLQLVVADDGRLIDIDLEGLPGDRDREKALREQARQVLVRSMAGFHMRLPPRNTLREGQWVEYDSMLFGMPVVRVRDRASARGPSVINVNTMGGSFTIHQLDDWKGQLIVQSKGEGTILIPNDEDDDKESAFKIDLDGVSIYDRDTGIMTERVWALQGRSTAGSYLGDGRADALYFHVGRIRKLEDDEKVTLSATGEIARPGVLNTSLPKWEAVD